MTSVGSITAPNVAVHLSYDSNEPPPHPGPQWTRFVCLSDTHSKCFAVPSGDVLLHSGDLSSFGRVGQLKVTMDWINELPHPIKVVIAGNHDASLRFSSLLVLTPFSYLLIRTGMKTIGQSFIGRRR
jgi:predicted phosphohydrolase